VQIAGADPQMMAQAARHNVDNGAQIIDINMGCPAKKVCNVMAGSALMQDEKLVGQILDAVVGAIPDTPVTLKFRTGWNLANKNAPTIARIAESAGVRAVAIHGRTRCQQYTGEAEYDTIAMVKTLIRIPVIANGDITTPEKARHVLDVTGADGIMIGRAAQGRPWLFREIEHYLKTGEHLPPAEVTKFTRFSRSTSKISTLLRPGNRFQGRPQAHLLVHQGAGWLGGLPQGNERPAQHRPTDAGSGRLLRPPGGGASNSKIHRGGVGSMSQHDMGNASRSRWSSISATSTAKSPPPSMTWS
jgi:tRNA-dihydrouridine synthase